MRFAILQKRFFKLDGDQTPLLDQALHSESRTNNDATPFLRETRKRSGRVRHKLRRQHHMLKVFGVQQCLSYPVTTWRQPKIIASQISKSDLALQAGERMIRSNDGAHWMPPVGKRIDFRIIRRFVGEANMGVVFDYFLNDVVGGTKKEIYLHAWVFVRKLFQNLHKLVAESPSERNGDCAAM